MASGNGADLMKDIILKLERVDKKSCKEQATKDTSAESKTRKRKVKSTSGSEIEEKEEKDTKVVVNVQPNVQKSKLARKCKKVPLKIESGEDLKVIDEEIKVIENKVEKLKNSISIARHLKCNKYIGAHVSINGGLWKAIEETEEIGGVALAMFLKSQRTWKSKDLDEKSVELFKEKLHSSGILSSMIIPHGSYLLNCGSADEEILRKTRECLVDEMIRCERLGISMYNIHPGSSKGTTVEHCIDLIVESINMAHEKTKNVVILIENMSKQGSTIGGDFNQLKSIIGKVKDKSRIGICFDTCHAFAAGYDLKSEDGYEKTKKEFEDVVGRKYLMAVHLNDSKGDLDCHLDRHENIGKGKLGLEFFERLMNDPFFNNVALVLETPECDYKKEIDLLYSLCHS